MRERKLDKPYDVTVGQMVDLDGRFLDWFRRLKVTNLKHSTLTGGKRYLVVIDYDEDELCFNSYDSIDDMEEIYQTGEYSEDTAKTLGCIEDVFDLKEMKRVKFEVVAKLKVKK